MTTYLAADLGASSVRVLCGRIDSDSLELTELHRVPNEPVQAGGTLHWDILSLYRAVLDGMRKGADSDPVSVGIDSWAVDYGLLDESGALLGNPVHYRDERTDGITDAVIQQVGAERLYQATGIQTLPINTLFQLAAARKTPQLRAADKLLMIPDLLGYWLTGEIGVESTNASSTQLFDLHAEDWALDIVAELGIPTGIFPKLRAAGDLVGGLTADVAHSVGLPERFPVTAVCSHDTASAVVAVPAPDEKFAYVSCGTWSLVGVELDRPVLSAESRAANFTNERGIDGSIRYLRNVMGLWLLQESMRSWGESDVVSLLAAAARESAFRSVVDPDAPEFLPAGDMPARIAEFCRRTGQPVPATPAAFTRCIVESLALAHRRAIRDAMRLSGRDVSAVHLVGGGSRNELLCQLTADACGLPVIAGPVEATAIGNVLVQARSQIGDVARMRDLVARTQPTTRYEPSGRTADWDAAAARIG
ncbi:MAG TPA: rhamnulokinase family protein [Mycobacteriales bacterium]|nr:rhamnulokinase family protein [Mycobacteriales bacterium]